MNTTQTADARTWRITLPVIIAYVMIGILIAVYSMAIYSYVRMQISDNTRINAAGRMRMLTQKMTKEILLFEDGKIPRSNVENSAMVFNITVYGITRGGVVPLDLNMTMSSRLPAMDGRRSRAELEGVILEWVPFRDHVMRFLNDRNPVSLKYILDNNEHLVGTIDRTVMAIQRHADRDLRDLWLIISSAIILVIGAVLATLVRQVKRSRSVETRLAEIEQLLPICSSCKKIRTDNNHPENPRSWTSIDEYLRDKKDMIFTHSICPDCMMKLYPGMDKDEPKKE
jgi:hypothetical protein